MSGVGRKKNMKKYKKIMLLNHEINSDLQKLRVGHQISQQLICDKNKVAIFSKRNEARVILKTSPQILFSA